MRRRPEQAIQRAVFEHLRQRGLPGVFAFHVPMGGFRRPIEAAIFQSLGVVRGVPDVIAIRDGHCYGLELKSEEAGARLSDAQRATLVAMQTAGATVAVAAGLDAALDKLTQWGLLRGTVA